MPANDSAPRPHHAAAAAAMWGAMHATEDMFHTKKAKKVQHLLELKDDDYESDLVEDLHWRVAREAHRLGRLGTPFSPEKVYRQQRNLRCEAGPKRMRQMPATLSADRAQRLLAGENLRGLVEDEWSEQVGAVFDAAWRRWHRSIQTRLAVTHPLVRVAVVTQRKDQLDWFTQHDSLVAADPIQVSRAGKYATSVLVHPNEAEALIDGELHSSDSVRFDYVLLPSAGVSAQRLCTAQRLREHERVRRSDPPLRPLIRALHTAAGILGEEVEAAVPAPSEDELKDMLLATLPAEPARQKRTSYTGHWPLPA